MNSSRLERPIRAAREIAEAHGVASDRCDVLQDGNTLVLRLSETLVARVVQDVDGPRHGMEWFTREIDVALFLAQHRAPVIPVHPELPPGPYEQLGYPVNFWKFVQVTDAEPDFRAIGKVFHQCHSVLKSYDGVLPELAIIHETITLLDEVQRRELFPPSEIEMLRGHLQAALKSLAGLPFQVLHGDAHEGNLLQTTEGLLLTDWEDTFLGPIEWDLASLLWNAKILESDHAKVDAILEAYRQSGGTWNETALEQCFTARAAVMCAWYPILYPNPSQERREKLRWRMDWLRKK